ncbi:MAG TPA: hypothetical protein VFO84_09285 [Dehalococcoidia bacterium]|nr:hypothetical protein [Dehalococcoidia bacterium]
MRTLHADLLAAQKQTSVIPVVSALVRDRHAGVTRAHPQSIYSGLETPDAHDLTVTADNGVVLRARRNAGDLELNTVADPDSSPNYGSWAQPFSVNNTTRLAIRANHDAGSQRVVIAHYNTGNTRIRRAVSSDEGANWAGINVKTAVPFCSGVACAPRNDSDEFVCWIEGGSLLGVRVIGGVVGTIRTSGLAFLAASGVSCDRIGDDFLVVLSATLSSGAQVVYASFFDWSADAWASAASVCTVIEADTGLSVDYLAPFVDTAGGETKLTFVERYTGTGAFERTLQCWLPPGAAASSERWSQPRPIVDVSGVLGMAVASDPLRGGAFWSRPDRVFRSLPVADLAIPQAHIESLEIDLQPFNGSCILRLDDPDRIYSPHVESVEHPLSVGAQLEISLGYRTASGDRTSTLPYFWIESLETLVEDSRRKVVIVARDVHSLLEAWRPRDATEYRASRSVFQIVDLTAARALVDYTTTSQSANLTALLPDWFHDTAFIRWLQRERPPGWQQAFYRDRARPSRGNPPPGVAAGSGVRWDVLERLLSPPVLLDLEASSNGLTALSRVLSTVRDVSYGQDQRLVTKDLNPAEASVYEYGDAGEHPLRRARYRRQAAVHNHVLTWGGAASDIVRSTPAWDELRDLGRESVVTVRDLAADSGAKADARAEAVLRPSLVGRREDVIETFPNAGQELWDVVRISESISGEVNDATRRVTAIRVSFDALRGEYLMWLTLGEP